MRSIFVCPLSKLDKVLGDSGAKRVISLLSQDTHFEKPEGISSENHLVLRFNDIVEPRKGLVSPNEQHVLELIAFARDWDWTSPLLVHCWAGISRSPASAAIIAVALSPTRSDRELALNMRDLSSQITPNIKMIELADKLLDRGQRMTEAFRSIGRGKDAFEGAPFELQI